MTTWGQDLLFPIILGLGIYFLGLFIFAVVLGAAFYEPFTASFFAFGSVDFDAPQHWTRSPPALLTHVVFVAAGYVTARSAKRLWVGLLPATLIGLGFSLYYGLWTILKPSSDLYVTMFDYLHPVALIMAPAIVLGAFGTALAGLVSKWSKK